MTSTVSTIRCVQVSSNAPVTVFGVIAFQRSANQGDQHDAGPHLVASIQTSKQLKKSRSFVAMQAASTVLMVNRGLLKTR